jgi:hypothetical protein
MISAPVGILLGSYDAEEIDLASIPDQRASTMGATYSETVAAFPVQSLTVANGRVISQRDLRGPPPEYEIRSIYKCSAAVRRGRDSMTIPQGRKVNAVESETPQTC